MRFMVVGNGAREHAISDALMRSQQVELYAFMSAKNPGIARLCRDFEIGDTCDPGAVKKYAQSRGIDVCVVGPEAPLEAGVVDAVESAGIKCAGPRKSPARIETDKSFARNLMKKYSIEGCPNFAVFENVNDALNFTENPGVQDGLNFQANSYVIKPSGLTGGKGVRVMGEHLQSVQDAKDYISSIFRKEGASVVIEDKLVGEEFTLQAFVDGTNVVGTHTIQDHKRAYENDIGPNTGGMGSYADADFVLPFLKNDDYEKAIEIMENVVKAIKKETGEPYRGFLYGQFMATRDGLKIIEFNARLGDPEAMNILSILVDDFAEICTKIAEGDLGDFDPIFADSATVCKYLVPKGYPDSPAADSEITADEFGIASLGGKIYYAAVREEDGKIYTSSSRAVAVVGIEDTIEAAEAIAEECIGMIAGNLYHRKDIGTKHLIQKRIDHLRALRGG